MNMMNHEEVSAERQRQRVQCSEQFFMNFYKLVQAVRIHQDNNQSVIQCGEDFLRALIQWSGDESHLSIHVIGGRFYFQDEKMLYRRETSNLINNMLDYFEKRRLHGLKLATDLQQVPFKNLLTFARIMNQAEKQGDPFEWLKSQLDGEDFRWVEVIKEPDTDPERAILEQEVQKEETELFGDPDQRRKEMGRKAYGHTVASLKEVAGKVSSQRRAGVRKSMRAVQNMIDLIIDDEPVLMGMSTIRGYDDYTYTHSVNVAILSLCLGLRIGLSRKSLALLGMCGIFHDLGKVDIDIDIINKPGKLTESEIDAVQKHSLHSVRGIVKLHATRELRGKILLPPFEHHLKYDLSGYPKTHRTKPITLFSRILTIVDVFDALTSPRVYRATAFSPDQALGRMQEGAGTDFDPILLKVFVNMLGVYPIGTALELDTGEIGLVLENPAGADPYRPRLVLIRPNEHGGYNRGEAVSLEERDGSTGRYRRNIIVSRNAIDYGIQPANFLF